MIERIEHAFWHQVAAAFAMRTPTAGLDGGVAVSRLELRADMPVRLVMLGQIDDPPERAPPGGQPRRDMQASEK